MTKPKNIAVTNKKTPLRARLRAVYKPGMSVTDLARATQSTVAQIGRAVRALRAEGFITGEVPHFPPGHAMREARQAALVTADMRAKFRRDVPEDMAAQIAAFPEKKITTLPPGGYQPSFAQLLGSKAAWVG